MLAKQAMINRAFPVTLDADNVIVAHHNFCRTADRAANADRLDFFKLFIMTLIGADSVYQRTGRADLDAGSTFDACAFAQWDIRVGDNDASGAAFCNLKGEVACKFTAGAYTAPAQDAAVIIQNKIWM